MYLCACLRPSLRKSDDMGSTTADALGFLAMPPVIARSKASLHLGRPQGICASARRPLLPPGKPSSAKQPSASSAADGRQRRRTKGGPRRNWRWTKREDERKGRPLTWFWRARCDRLDCESSIQDFALRGVNARNVVGNLRAKPIANAQLKMRGGESSPYTKSLLLLLCCGSGRRTERRHVSRAMGDMGAVPGTNNNIFCQRSHADAARSLRLTARPFCVGPRGAPKPRIGNAPRTGRTRSRFPCYCHLYKSHFPHVKSAQLPGGVRP